MVEEHEKAHLVARNRHEAKRREESFPRNAVNSNLGVELYPTQAEYCYLCGSQMSHRKRTHVIA